MTIQPRIVSFKSLAWYASRALCGQTPAPVRAYSFQHDVDAEIFILKAEVDRELTEDEREDLAVVETEIWTDMFLDSTISTETMVVLVPFGESLDPGKDGIVYLRDGEHVPPGYAGLPPSPAWKPTA